MSKLQRAVDGQTIEFIQLPRIFQNLSADLPSGAVLLPNGEKAFWRLHRNITELKRQRKNIRDLAGQLAKAFKSLTNSDAFRNHYGLSEAPQIDTESNLTGVFRNLLSVNTNRVDYSAISHGAKKSLVESIIIPLGNLVFMNAYRGVQSLPKASGLKGTLWLTESADEDQGFSFTIASPVVKLPEYINADRLKVELLGKIKQNLQIIAHNPKIVFAEGQFDDYRAASLKALIDQHAHPENGAGKKKGQKIQNSTAFGSTIALGSADPAIRAVKETEALHRESFNELDETGKLAYVGMIQKMAEANEPGSRSTLIAYLVSGIMEAKWATYNETAYPKVTQSYFLALTAGIKLNQFKQLMGDSEEVNLPRVKAEAGATYTVVADDTLSALALEAYGDASQWPAIAQANAGNIPNPDLIFPGQLLVIPELLSLTATEAIAEFITYQVLEGDTPESISEKAYGTSVYWTNILEANKEIISDDALPVGIVLHLPVIAEGSVPHPGPGADEASFVTDIEAANAFESLVAAGEKLAAVLGSTDAADSISGSPVISLGEDSVALVELENARGMNTATFLETHDATKFTSGSWASLLGDDGNMFEVINANGVWYHHNVMNTPLAGKPEMVVAEETEIPYDYSKTGCVGDDPEDLPADLGEAAAPDNSFSLKA